MIKKITQAVLRLILAISLCAYTLKTGWEVKPDELTDYVFFLVLAVFATGFAISYLVEISGQSQKVSQIVGSVLTIGIFSGGYFYLSSMTSPELSEFFHTGIRCNRFALDKIEGFVTEDNCNLSALRFKLTSNLKPEEGRKYLFQATDLLQKEKRLTPTNLGTLLDDTSVFDKAPMTRANDNLKLLETYKPAEGENFYGIDDSSFKEQMKASERGVMKKEEEEISSVLKAAEARGEGLSPEGEEVEQKFRSFGARWSVAPTTSLVAGASDGGIKPYLSEIQKAMQAYRDKNGKYSYDLKLSKVVPQPPGISFVVFAAEECRKKFSPESTSVPIIDKESLKLQQLPEDQATRVRAMLQLYMESKQGYDVSKVCPNDTDNFVLFAEVLEGTEISVYETRKNALNEVRHVPIGEVGKR